MLRRLFETYMCVPELSRSEPSQENVGQAILQQSRGLASLPIHSTPICSSRAVSLGTNTCVYSSTSHLLRLAQLRDTHNNTAARSLSQAETVQSCTPAFPRAGSGSALLRHKYQLL